MRRTDDSTPSASPAQQPETTPGQTFILCGSPRSVADQILEFAADCDVDRVDLLAHIPGLSHAAVQQTLTLYAHEVAPMVGVTMLAPTVGAVR